MMSANSGYLLPGLFAVVLHVLVGALFLVEWQESRQVLAEPTPKHIVANLVLEQNQAVVKREEVEKRKQQKVKEEQKRKAIADRKRKEEAHRKAKVEAEKQRKQAEAAARKKEAEEQLRIKKEQEALAKQREQELLEQELRSQEEALLAEAELEQSRLDEVNAQQQAEIQAEQDARTVVNQTALIREKITSVWLYPPHVNPDQEVTVNIGLVPTGEVISVTVVKGSGNQALDRSVEQAVFKASPLPVPKDIRVFENHFRHFTILFRPENATW